MSVLYFLLCSQLYTDWWKTVGAEEVLKGPVLHRRLGSGSPMGHPGLRPSAVLPQVFLVQLSKYMKDRFQETRCNDGYMLIKKGDPHAFINIVSNRLYCLWTEIPT